MLILATSSFFSLILAFWTTFLLVFILFKLCVLLSAVFCNLSYCICSYFSFFSASHCLVQQTYVFCLFVLLSRFSAAFELLISAFWLSYKNLHTFIPLFTKMQILYFKNLYKYICVLIMLAFSLLHLITAEAWHGFQTFKHLKSSIRIFLKFFKTWKTNRAAAKTEFYSHLKWCDSSQNPAGQGTCSGDITK